MVWNEFLYKNTYTRKLGLGGTEAATEDGEPAGLAGQTPGREVTVITLIRRAQFE